MFQKGNKNINYGKRKEFAVKNIIPHPTVSNCSLIPLTQNQFALIDNKDIDFVKDKDWFVKKEKLANGSYRYYAYTKIWINNKRTSISLHKFLWQKWNKKITSRYVLDHKDRNSLNNTECNLRLASRNQNGYNSNKKSNNTSGFKGVTWHKGKWYSQVTHEGKKYYIGSFLDKLEAAKAYDIKVKELHGEFAVLNFPEETRKFVER